MSMYSKSYADMSKLMDNPELFSSASSEKIQKSGLATRKNIITEASSLDIDDPTSGLNPAPELVSRFKKYRDYSNNASTAREEMIAKIGRQESDLEKSLPRPRGKETTGLIPVEDFDEGMISFAVNAIADVESKGSGDYSAVGKKVTKGMYKGEKALGRYQVMPSNVAGWTEKHYGEELTPEEFLANPEAQDAVVEGELMANFDKYGSIEDAVSVWFTGDPLDQATRRGAADQNITVGSYLKKWRAAYNTYAAQENL